MYQDTIDYLYQKMYTYEPYNPCFYSSFVFIINVLVTFYYGYHLYSGLFFTLLITSLFQHSHYIILTNIFDKIAVYCVVFYGGYIFYNKISDNISSEIVKFNTKQYILSGTIMITFISTAVLYYYGYLNTCLCFSDNHDEAHLFHVFMHCVASFGHCCIVFL